MTSERDHVRSSVDNLSEEKISLMIVISTTLTACAKESWQSIFHCFIGKPLVLGDGVETSDLSLLAPPSFPLVASSADFSS